MRDLVCHEDAIIAQAQSPDGTSIATLSKDETIALWKVFDPLTQEENANKTKAKSKLLSFNSEIDFK